MESKNTSTKKNYLNLLVVVFTPAIVFTILGLCFMIPGLFASKSTGQIDKDTANDLVGTYYAKTNGIRYQKLTVSKSHPDTITIGAMTQNGKPCYICAFGLEDGNIRVFTNHGSVNYTSSDN